MIDYKKRCKWELGCYYDRVQSLESLQEELDQCNASIDGIRSPRNDAIPVQGGSSTAEERLINTICNRDDLVEVLEHVKGQVHRTEVALSALTDQQRRILDVTIMQGGYNSVERLCEELHVSRTELYRRRGEALKRYTICRYGITEM